MPRTSDGTYALPANTEAVSGETIESAKYNAVNSDFETEFNKLTWPITQGQTVYTTMAAFIAADDVVDGSIVHISGLGDFKVVPDGTYTVEQVDDLDIIDLTGSSLQAVQVGPNFGTRENLVLLAGNGVLSAYADGNTVRAEGVEYVKSSGATAITDLAGWLPSGSTTVAHFGADKTGTNDSLAAFNACIAYAGDDGAFSAAAGNYDLSGPIVFKNDGQTVVLAGCVFNGSFVIGRPNINILGRPIIDPDAFGSRTPFYGVLSVYAQDRAKLDVRVFNVDGPAYVTGNTYRAQVAVGDIAIYAENCGMVACHGHGMGGIIGYVRHDESSTLPTITSGGTGYTDGRWMAPLTGGDGSGAIIAFDIVGGVVSDFFIAQGGKDYTSGDTLSFTNAEAINSAQGVMSAGSGFSLTVGSVQESGASATSWFNENKINYAANRGWYGGISSYGRYNYNTSRNYLEAIWSRTTPLIDADEGIDHVFEKLTVLVNENVAETTDRGTKLVNMPNAFGTKVLSGRSGNPYSTEEMPYRLYDFGKRSTFAFDAFTDVSSTRGYPWREFTPTVIASNDLSDFAATYSVQYGRFRDQSGSVEFEVTLEFDTDAYTTSMSVMEIGLTDMITEIGEDPNGNIFKWPVEVLSMQGFSLDTSNAPLYGEWQNHLDYIRIYQRLTAGDDPISQGEIVASTTGYKVSLRGRFDY
jgi:hypothetical protein